MSRASTRLKKLKAEIVLLRNRNTELANDLEKIKETRDTSRRRREKRAAPGATELQEEVKSLKELVSELQKVGLMCYTIEHLKCILRVQTSKKDKKKILKVRKSLSLKFHFVPGVIYWYSCR